MAPAALTGPVMVLGLGAAVWRLFYPQTDWAIIGLVPSGCLIWLGHWRTSMALHEARLHAALRGTSWIARFLRGGLRTALSATLLTGLGLALIADRVLTANALTWAVLAGLTFASALVTGLVRGWLHRHLHPPFATAGAVTTATILCGTLFAIVDYHVTWAYTDFPGNIRVAGNLAEAALAGVQSLPARDSWLSDLIGALRAIDAAKLWLATRDTWQGWGLRCLLPMPRFSPLSSPARRL